MLCACAPCCAGISSIGNSSCGTGVARQGCGGTHQLAVGMACQAQMWGLGGGGGGGAVSCGREGVQVARTGWPCAGCRAVYMRVFPAAGSAQAAELVAVAVAPGVFVHTHSCTGVGPAVQAAVGGAQLLHGPSCECQVPLPVVCGRVLRVVYAAAQLRARNGTSWPGHERCMKPADPRTSCWLLVYLT
jgi:hypothetical protein